MRRDAVETKQREEDAKEKMIIVRRSCLYYL
jgi:hypothetical protein